MDVIELDPEILNVAEKWFGFVQGEGVKVCVGDGAEAIRQKCAAGEKGECWFSETISEPPFSPSESPTHFSPSFYCLQYGAAFLMKNRAGPIWCYTHCNLPHSQVAMTLSSLMWTVRTLVLV